VTKLNLEWLEKSFPERRNFNFGQELIAITLNGKRMTEGDWTFYIQAYFGIINRVNTMS